MGNFEKISESMAIAVILSDLKIVTEERQYLLDRKIMSNEEIDELDKKDFEIVIQKLVTDSLKLAKEENLGREKISELLVELFDVSCVDGQISLLELKTIHDFAEKSGFTKEELAYYLMNIM